MASRYDLTPLFLGSIRKHIVDLPLAQNFQMRVRFIEQENGARVNRKMGQQQQSLLKTSSSGRHIKANTGRVSVRHVDLAAFRDVDWLVELNSEQSVNFFADLSPPSFTIRFGENLVAEI